MDGFSQWSADDRSLERRKDTDLMPDQVRFIVVNDKRFYHPRFGKTRTRTHNAVQAQRRVVLVYTQAGACSTLGRQKDAWC